MFIEATPSALIKMTIPSFFLPAPPNNFYTVPYDEYDAFCTDCISLDLLKKTVQYRFIRSVQLGNILVTHQSVGNGSKFYSYSIMVYIINSSDISLCYPVGGSVWLCVSSISV